MCSWPKRRNSRPKISAKWTSRRGESDQRDLCHSGYGFNGTVIESHGLHNVGSSHTQIFAQNYNHGTMTMIKEFRDEENGCRFF
jgi:hypothetical protein